MPYNNPIVGGTTLIIPAINSKGFQTGVTGWSINRDGSAEFSNVTIRGIIIVGNPGTLITNIIPAEITTFYTAHYGTTVVRSIIIQFTGAGSYHYDLVFTGTVVATELHSSGWVNAALVVQEERTDYTAGTGVQRLIGATSPYSSTIYGPQIKPGFAVSEPTYYWRNAILDFGFGMSQDPDADMRWDTVSLARGPIPGAQVSAVTNSAGIGTVETSVMVIPTTTYPPNRAFVLEFGWAVVGSIAGTEATFRLRESVGGTLLADNGKITCPLANVTYKCGGRMIFCNGTNNSISATLQLTLQESGVAGTVLLEGLVGRPRFAIVSDIGSATAFPFAISL